MTQRYIVCPGGIYSHEVPPGNVEWDSTHYCPASALTPAEASQFSVVPLVEEPPPPYDPVTQSLTEVDPEYVNNAWRQQWLVENYPPVVAAKNLADLKVESRQKIDDDSGLCYTNALNGLGSEYQMAEEDAQAYRNSGYAPPVPKSVQSLADALQITTQDAADRILAGAAEWRVLQNDVRANRLAYKAEVAEDTTYSEVMDTMARWDAYVAGTNGEAGTIFQDL